jgi:hypothetical protein
MLPASSRSNSEPSKKPALSSYQASSSEMSVDFQQTIWRYIPEDITLNISICKTEYRPPLVLKTDYDHLVFNPQIQSYQKGPLEVIPGL